MPKKNRDIRVNEILEAAVEEFLNHGYDGTTMDSIARRAGLTKGGLYHHFANKDAILLAANQLFSQPIAAAMEAAAREADALTGLRGFFRHYVLYWANHPREIAFFFLSMSKMIAEADLRVAMGSYYDQTMGFYRSRLDMAVAQGSLRPHDTASRALTIMMALDGITAYVSLASVDHEMIIHHLDTSLLADLVTTAATPNRVRF
jgi:AcrR family transcriptional regulator